jgi:hypothetical protein
MLQTVSRLVIGLFLIVLCITGFALVSQAPRLKGDIASVSVQSGNDGALISGRQLDCTRTPGVDRCTISLEGQPLEMVITGITGNLAQPPLNPTVNCQATYAGRSLECYGFTHYPAPYGMYAVSINDDLGLSRQTLEQLRRENGLVRFWESSWWKFITCFAAITGAVASLAVWGHLHWLNRIFVGISHGLAGIVIALAIASPLRSGRFTFFHLPVLWLLNLPGWMAMGIGFVAVGIAIGLMLRSTRALSGISLGLLMYVTSVYLSAIGLSTLGYL